MNSNFFNLSKRKKRDLLLELLVGSTTEGIISKKELNALNKLIQSTSIYKGSINNSSPQGIIKVTPERKKQKQRKIKTTCYLSEETSKNLNAAQANIKAILPEEFHSRISKSHLMEHALVLMLDELDTEGKNSKLLSNILRNI